MTVTAGRRSTANDIVTSATPRRTAPVKIWATIGAAFLALMIYTLVSWVLSDDFRQIPAGPTPLPSWMKVALVILTAIGPGLMVPALYYFLIRPWRRTGRITTDGMFLLALWGTFWLDGLGPWVAPHYTFNSWLFNRGNWGAQVPGMVNPTASNLAEPLLINIPVYLYWVGGVTLLSTIVMRRIRDRRPHLTGFGLVWRMFALFLVVDFVLEMVFLRLGYYVFPTTIRALTVFPDEYYRFPVYEAVLWGGAWTAFSAARFFTNDRGETLAERGVNDLKISTRGKQWLRFLAINGIISVIFMGFHISTLPFLLNSDEWPADIKNRSYFTSQMCGAGTEYACWGPETPIPRHGSDHVDPQGRLVPGSARR